MVILQLPQTEEGEGTTLNEELTLLKAELLEIIANGENSGIEFKRDDVRPEKLAKEVAAMANLQGGRILLGVDDDGAIVGVQRPDLELWVMDTVFGRYVHPLMLPFYEEIRMGGGRDPVFEETEDYVKTILGQIKGHGNFINDSINTPITRGEGEISPNGASLSELQRHIMDWIEANAAISYDQIAALSGKGKATVRRNIQKLKQSGHLERVGSKKTGQWRALK